MAKAFINFIIFSNRRSNLFSVTRTNPPCLVHTYFNRKMSTSPITALENLDVTKTESEVSPNQSTPSDGIVVETNGTDETTAKVELTPAPYQRIKKRKIVLLLSYSGQGYFGMQKNPDTKTIEGELLDALCKAAYIDEECCKKPQAMQFQRAARTDKSVSAARQIVSMKLPETVDLSKINELLPPQIRVMGMRRVTKGFDAKGNCDARTYKYMIPTFAFVPVDQLVTEDYHITPEVLGEVRKTLQIYVGTKNFHNFTSRRKATDPSAQRYMLDFTCSDPFVKDGLEYVILKVKGQSFMLHQIRKMIGLVVAILRGFAGMETVEKTWTKNRIDIPKAPGVGLFLDQVHYERYNERYGSDGMHDTLAWKDEEETVEKFCHNYIYPVITKTENEEKSMLNWLGTLMYHTYDIRNPAARELSAIGKAHLAVADEPVESSDEEEDEIKPKRPKIDSKSVSDTSA